MQFPNFDPQRQKFTEMGNFSQDSQMLQRPQISPASPSEDITDLSEEIVETPFVIEELQESLPRLSKSGLD
jgi:hypothetical protein